jgi:predicted CoA-binding protein
MNNNVTEQQILEILQNNHNIAVVGLSDKPDRASYRVAEYMQDHGYRIIPVNPQLKTVLGETAYPDLLSIPDKVDIVNLFRRSDDVPPIVDEALQLKPYAVWLQLGIINQEAAEKCRAAGVSIIMDKCIKIEHCRFFPEEA